MDIEIHASYDPYLLHAQPKQNWEQQRVRETQGAAPSSTKA